MVEKDCLTLVFATQKFRHYFLTHEAYLCMHDDPVRHLLQQPAMSGHTAHGLVKLMEFDIKYFTQNIINGQPLAELLASHLTLPTDTMVDPIINVANITPNH